MDISIIIPYRNRQLHLRKFLPAIEHHLRREKVSAEVMIIEQADEKPFNRAKLLNIGFLHSTSGHVVFHDVDMLPLAPTSYKPQDNATHLAGRASQFRYQMPYKTYFGGVTMFCRKSFEKVNGFSNVFWGWGAEDDDMFNRCEKMNVPIKWMPYRFQSLHHRREIINSQYQANKDRLMAGTDMNTDGLSSCEFQEQGAKILVNKSTFVAGKISVLL